MWFQIELPSAATVTEIQFSSTFQAAGRGAVPGARGGGAGQWTASTAPSGPSRAATACSSRWTAAPGARPSPKARAVARRRSIAFPSGAAKFIRITQTGTATDNAPWSMQRRPVAEGQGSGSRTVIVFPPAAAKFIRITQTGTATDSAPWSMQRLRLFAAPARGAGSAVR